MTRVKSIGMAEARPKLTQLVDEVAGGGDPYLIVSGSQVKAVLVGVNQYNDMVERLEDLSDAAELLKAHPDWVEEVRVDHLPPRDIDTVDDEADLEAAAAGVCFDLLIPSQYPAPAAIPSRTTRATNETNRFTVFLLEKMSIATPVSTFR